MLLKAVGFSPIKKIGVILMTTTIHISGLGDAAYFLVSSSFVLPLLVLHVEFTITLLVRLWVSGTCAGYDQHAPTG